MPALMLHFIQLRSTCYKGSNMAHILLVDDDPDVVETTALVLSAEGHAVEVAWNGKEGLDALERGLPDLVILDIEMPVLDGREMAKWMFVRDCGAEQVPVLLVSGAANLKRVAEIIGTPYCLAKPYHLDVFLRLVERAISERKPPSPPSLEGVCPVNLPPGVRPKRAT